MWYLRRVVGKSMKPTFREGQTVLVSLFRRYKEGDIVVAYVNKREVIKRIQEMREDGQVFLVGDNPKYSTDSREYGWVPDRYISGKVVWPRRPLKKLQ